MSIIQKHKFMKFFFENFSSRLENNLIILPVKIYRNGQFVESLLKISNKKLKWFLRYHKEKNFAICCPKATQPRKGQRLMILLVNNNTLGYFGRSFDVYGFYFLDVSGSSLQSKSLEVSGPID